MAKIIINCIVNHPEEGCKGHRVRGEFDSMDEFLKERNLMESSGLRFSAIRSGSADECASAPREVYVVLLGVESETVKVPEQFIKWLFGETEKGHDGPSN